LYWLDSGPCAVQVSCVEEPASSLHGRLVFPASCQQAVENRWAKNSNSWRGDAKAYYRPVTTEFGHRKKRKQTESSFFYNISFKQKRSTASPCSTVLCIKLHVQYVIHIFRILNHKIACIYPFSKSWRKTRLSSRTVTNNLFSNKCTRELSITSETSPRWFPH
jgi:hypothetical protein